MEARDKAIYSTAGNVGYWRYDEPFGVDAVAVVKWTYECNLTGDWEVRLIHDSDAAMASATVEHTLNSGSAASGTITSTLATAERYIAFQFYNNNAVVATGLDVYFRITAIEVRTTTETTTTAQEIAEDIVQNKYNAARLGLSNSVTQIDQTLTFDMNSSVFDDDKTGEDVLNIISEYGDASGEQVGWAVWEDKELVLETIPLDEVRMQVAAEDAVEIAVDGNVQRNFQRAYAVARDQDGWAVRGTTRDYFDDLTNDEVFGDRRRTRPVDVPITASTTEAQTLVDLFLKRNALPAGRGRVVLQGSGLRTRWGNELPLPRARAGEVLQIKRFRAAEAEALASATDLRDRSYTDLVVHTEYDAERDELTLSPGEVDTTLAQELGVLKKQLGPGLWGNRTPVGQAGV